MRLVGRTFLGTLCMAIACRFASAESPAVPPFDWLSRDSAIVVAFISDPLCFALLQPTALARFFAAALQLSDPAGLRKIRNNLPIYLFSGSEDPVGQQLEGVQVLIERYRKAGIHDVWAAS